MSVVVVGNHESILQTVGFEVRKYRYWSKETLGLDIDGLIADLEAAPEKSVILLHACSVSFHFRPLIDKEKPTFSHRLIFSTIQLVVIQHMNNGCAFLKLANLVN